MCLRTTLLHFVHKFVNTQLIHGYDQLGYLQSTWLISSYALVQLLVEPLHIVYRVVTDSVLSLFVCGATDINHVKQHMRMTQIVQEFVAKTLPLRCPWDEPSHYSLM